MFGRWNEHKQGVIYCHLGNGAEYVHSDEVRSRRTWEVDKDASTAFGCQTVHRKIYIGRQKRYFLH